MTYTVYAFTNDKACLLVKKAEIYNDVDAAEVLAEVWLTQGFFVTQTQEG